MPEVTLRPASEAEYHLFFRGYQSDPLIDSHPFVYSREMVSRSYQYNYSGIQKGYAHYGIFCGDQMIGCFQLKRMNFEKKSCEFGIILQNDSLKGKGYGTQAVILGICEAKDHFKIRYLIADTMSINFAMRRIFDKLGFDLTETVPNAYQLSDGSMADRLVYQKDLGGSTEHAGE